MKKVNETSVEFPYSCISALYHKTEVNTSNPGISGIGRALHKQPSGKMKPKIKPCGILLVIFSIASLIEREKQITQESGPLGPLSYSCAADCIQKHFLQLTQSTDNLF